MTVGGFDYLYDKTGIYDTLRAIQTGSVSAAALTSCWQQTEGLGPHMLNFLENHDEQRFASPQYAGDPAKVIPSLVVSSMINTGPMMIYMGQELGEPATDEEGYSGRDGRTTIFDYSGAWAPYAAGSPATAKAIHRQRFSHPASSGSADSISTYFR